MSKIFGTRNQAFSNVLSLRSTKHDANSLFKYLLEYFFKKKLRVTFRTVSFDNGEVL